MYIKLLLHNSSVLATIILDKFFCTSYTNQTFKFESWRSVLLNDLFAADLLFLANIGKQLVTTSELYTNTITLHNKGPQAYTVSNFVCVNMGLSWVTIPDFFEEGASNILVKQ